MMRIRAPVLIKGTVSLKATSFYIRLLVFDFLVGAAGLEPATLSLEG